MHNKSKLAFYIAVTAFLTLGFSISLQSLLAEWTAPESNPPISEIKEPIYNWGNKDFNLIQTSLGVAEHFSVGGDKFFVDYSTYNVGIGTVNPTAKLHITNNSGQFNLRSVNTYTGAASIAGGFYNNVSNGSYNNYAILASATNPGGGSGIPYSFYGSAGTLYNNGNVGVGTANISSGLKLDVEGRVGATQYCDNNGLNCKTITQMGGGFTRSSCAWVYGFGYGTVLYAPAGSYIAGLYHNGGTGGEDGIGMYYCYP